MLFLQPVKAVGPRLDRDRTSEMCTPWHRRPPPVGDARAPPYSRGARFRTARRARLRPRFPARSGRRRAQCHQEEPSANRRWLREQCPAQLRSAERPAGQRHDPPVTNGDLAEVLGVADRRFQAVDQVETWIGKQTAGHDTTSDLASFAGPIASAGNQAPTIRTALCRADQQQFVKVAAHLESARLVVRRSSSARNPPFGSSVRLRRSRVVVRHVEQPAGSGDRWLEDSKRSADMVPNARASVSRRAATATTSPDDCPSGRSRTT